MNSVPIQAKVDYDDVNPMDFMDVLKSTKIFNEHGLRTLKVKLEPEGEGVEQLIDWASDDIYEAMLHQKNNDEKGRKRKATGAVLNARRALSCLIDWYIKRDGFCYCKGYSDKSEEKSMILMRLGIIDQLTSNVLKRLIDIRNSAEHKYQSVSLEDGEDIVELIRRLYGSLRSISKPHEMNIIWGYFPYGYEWSGESYKFHFSGWEKPCFILQLTEKEPWVGVVLPITKEKALVRRSFLRYISVDLLFEIHIYVQASMDAQNKNWRYFDSDRAIPVPFYRELCKLCGLV